MTTTYSEAVAELERRKMVLYKFRHNNTGVLHLVESNAVAPIGPDIEVGNGGSVAAWCGESIMVREEYGADLVEGERCAVCFPPDPGDPD